jgi:DNA-binding transcriptional regulator YiaG
MMTHEQFRSAIEELGLSQVAVARLLGVNDRTARRWAAGDLDIPQPVEIVLSLMIEYEITPDDVAALIGAGEYEEH